MNGKSINGYTIKKLLGSGGMADVYYAENKLGRRAAIKVLKKKWTEESVVKDRFVAEAQIMVSLDHPNILKVYDIDEIDGQAAIVMEYLEGNTLSEALRSSKRLSDETLKICFNQSCDALNYTHKKGVIHRDIKPSNIFLTADRQIKIMDFGIAKVKENSAHTNTGQTLGTVIYMSPEQVNDPKRVSYKTDNYSLAVTFYHLLTGKAPYDLSTDSDWSVQTKIVQEEIDLSNLTENWNKILSQLLIKDPKKRGELIGYSTTKKLDTDETLYEEIKPQDQDWTATQSKKLNTQVPWIIGSIVLILSLALILNFPTDSEEMDDFPNLVVFQDENTKLFGYMGQDGRIVIPANYTVADSFINNRATVELRDSVYIISSSGDILNRVQKNIVKTEKLDTGQSKVIDETEAKSNKSVNINRKKYDWIGSYSKKTKLKIVERNDLYGYIDLEGNEIIPLVYTGATELRGSYNRIYVKKASGWGVVDRSNNTIVPFESERYEDLPGYSEKSKTWLEITKKDGKVGFRNYEGELVIPYTYKNMPGSCQYDYDGSKCILCKSYENYEIVDRKTSEVLKLNFEGISNPSFLGQKDNLLIRVRKEDKYGYINLSQVVVIPTIYDFDYRFGFERFNNFEYEVCRVKLEGIKFYIDKNNRCVQDCPTDSLLLKYSIEKIE